MVRYVRDASRDMVSATTQSYSPDEVEGKLRDFVEKLERNEFVDKAYIIQSFSDPWKKYVVYHRKDGTWKCTCPMFRFNIPKGRYLHKAYRLPSGQLVCKHIAYVFQNQHILVPFIDREGKKVEVKDYAVNVVDLDGVEARIITISDEVGRDVVKEAEVEEDIPIFLDDYERLGIELPKEEKHRDRDMEMGF